MIIEEISVTAFQQHTRIVGCPETHRAICIDPGDEADRIAGELDRLGLELQAITLTHAHLDHVGGVAALKALRPSALILLHLDDEPLYRALPEQPALLGVPRANWKVLGLEFVDPPAIDRYWQDGEDYSVGNLNFKIIHCPGHTPGHVVLFEAQERAVFVGDCLFAGSIGRTDLPGGSSDQLMDSIMNRIVPLGDDVTVYSGHGPATTIGEERRTNPFLTGMYSIGKGSRF
ncbi:MAG: MBL fold metallo-hydrolase [Pyrinomonadaceae bacterium]